MKRAMIDFETIGNGKHACIVQVGACYFENGGIGQCLKLQVDAEDAVRNGAEMAAATVYWWLSQSPEAIKSVTATPRLREVDALNQLNAFLAGADEIWSHATFDFVILMEALKRVGMKPLFGYRAARDIRTLNALCKLDMKSIVREGTHHDGLDDAIYQARYVMAMLKEILHD